MDRDEILRRMVTGAEYMERSDITPTQREKAKARYDELQSELNKIDEAEKVQVEPDIAQIHIAKIREILKPVKRSS